MTAVKVGRGSANRAGGLAACHPRVPPIDVFLPSPREFSGVRNPGFRIAGTF
jgi:hypothetical protein